jgi:tryptophan-rich sensory protein
MIPVSQSPPAHPRPIAALAGWLLFCFAASASAAFGGPDAWYQELFKPAWNPPAWIFGPVWSLLYGMMAFAAWQVWRLGGWRQQWRPLRMFVLQWVLNAAWSPLFFGLHRPGVALVEILALWLAVTLTIRAFWRVRRTAALLMVPYWAWVGFATGLNAALWWMNS